MFSFLRRRRPWPKVSVNRMRRIARIIVIDDEPFDYAELFRDDGYTIEHWNDVQSLDELERGVFDIIVLDIGGIGRKLSADEGLGILRQVRRANPSQLIVAWSGMTFSLKHKEFFDLADASLEKSTDYVDFKSTIDNLLEKRFSLSYYVERIRELARPQIEDGAKLRSAAAGAIMNGESQHLQKYLAGISMELEQRNALLHVSGAAISVLERLRE